MFRRSLVAAVVVVALASSAAGVLPAAAEMSTAVVTHTLIVEVNPAAGKKLAVLVLIRQNGGVPAGAVATPSKPLRVHLGNSGLYRVTAEIDSACKGRCGASSRVLGSHNHRLEVVPSCRPRGSGLVCSTVKIVSVS